MISTRAVAVSIQAVSAALISAVLSPEGKEGKTKVAITTSSSNRKGIRDKFWGICVKVKVLDNKLRFSLFMNMGLQCANY